MGRIVNDLDTIQFSIKKASQLVKEIGRQVATDKCIMLFLVLIACGVIAIIVVKKLVEGRSANIMGQVVKTHQAIQSLDRRISAMDIQLAEAENRRLEAEFQLEELLIRVYRRLLL